MRNSTIFNATVFLCLVFSSAISARKLTFISWNIRDFGGSRSDAEIELIADVLAHADIIAIQEVVARDPAGAKAVARLVNALNRKGSSWDYRISDPTIYTSPQKVEKYAFVWKASQIQVIGGRPTLIKELAHTVEREPYLISFRMGQKELSILNYHACTHTKEFPERDEIMHISRWIMNQNMSNVIFAGDMNLVIQDEAFRQLKQNAYSHALNGEKTTLKKECSDGDYLSSAEDNILYKFSNLKYQSSKVIDFVGKLRCESVKQKSVMLSDHLAVELIFTLM
ncbi:MAG TPA: endonuclease/exonuclease/phosphatase family protein [Saprospiraceae bacterium]|nr:endonuclease/exonuclease/phosphatase family protein [Saprospiraceae bacterium]